MDKRKSRLPLQTALLYFCSNCSPCLPRHYFGCLAFVCKLPNPHNGKLRNEVCERQYFLSEVKHCAKCSPGAAKRLVEHER